jgi:hypothetical protein
MLLLLLEESVMHSVVHHGYISIYTCVNTSAAVATIMNRTLALLLLLVHIRHYLS